MNQMPVVECADVHRWYAPARHVLRGVDWRVWAGEVVGLLGRNGAGKSTLLRMLVSYLQPQQGTVRLWGRDPWVDDAVKAEVGYLAETDAWPWMTRVGDVMDLHRAVYPRWDAELADAYLRRFELEHKRRINTLSKGQRRAVGLIAAVAHRPPLLLLDEPAGGLDPALRREFLGTILTRLAEDGGTTVFSSHHVGELERVATHVALLEDGRLAFHGTVEACVEGHALVWLPRPDGLTPDDLAARTGAVAWREEDGRLALTIPCAPADAPARLLAAGYDGPLEVESLGLEDVFIARAGGRV